MAFGLTAAQKLFYDDNGYLVVRGVLPREETLMYRQELHDLSARLHSTSARVDVTWSSVQQQEPAKRTEIYHCHDVQFHCSSFARLLVDVRFTSLAQGVLDCPNVQLHHTKMFIKPPEKGSPFPMHQDYPYFPHRQNTMMAAIFYFDDCPVEKGCFRVIPGSHKLGPLPCFGGDHHLPPEQYRIEDALPLTGQAGDVIFFSYLTIHGSGINISNEARTTCLVQMRDPTDPPTQATHLSRGQGMMLAGIDPTCGQAAPTAQIAGAMG